MEFYIPSLFILLLAAIILVLVVPRLSPLVLIIVCTLLLTWAFANHYTLFSDEYRNMNWLNTATVAGPYVMISLVIVLCVGYITLLVSSGESTNIKAPSMNIPPPETATNYVTRGIGNSLIASGLSPEPGKNSISLDESAISKKF